MWNIGSGTAVIAAKRKLRSEGTILKVKKKKKKFGHKKVAKDEAMSLCYWLHRSCDLTALMMTTERTRARIKILKR